MGQNTKDKGVARQNTIDRGSNTMGSGVDIRGVGGSIYHGYIFFCVSGEYFFFRVLNLMLVSRIYFGELTSRRIGNYLNPLFS